MPLDKIEGQNAIKDSDAKASSSRRKTFNSIKAANFVVYLSFLNAPSKGEHY
jgi:hypothetical protein